MKIISTFITICEIIRDIAFVAAMFFFWDELSKLKKNFETLDNKHDNTRYALKSFLGRLSDAGDDELESLENGE